MRGTRSLLRAVSELTPWKSYWLFNILLGVFIALLLEALQDSRLVVAAQNWASDVAMQGSAALGELPARSVPPLAVVDVDEETWRAPQWGGGEPFYAPRPELLKLIDYAFAHRARYVVLDVLVEDKNTAENAAFVAGIEALLPRLQRTQQYLLLVRSIREPLFAENVIAPEVHPSPLDTAISHDPERLVPVAPYFRVSRDGVLRDWHLWSGGCVRETADGRGHWRVVPSVQLAIAAIERSGGPDVVPWQRRTAIPCATGVMPGAPQDVSSQRAELNTAVSRWLAAHPKITNGAQQDDLGDAANALSNRIDFVYANRPEPGKVRIVSALKVLQGDPHTTSLDFGNGVVIIGQSFAAARDQHATPLGLMPGTQVLANSIDSMLGTGLLRRPNDASMLLFELFSIVFVGFVFARMNSFWGVLFIAVSFVPILVAANYLLLRSGVWLDFSVPLLALYIHKLVKGAEEFVRPRLFGKREAVH